MTPMTIVIHGLRLGRGGNDRGSWKARYYGRKKRMGADGKARREPMTGSRRQRDVVSFAITQVLACRLSHIVRDGGRTLDERFRNALGAGPWTVTVTRVAPGSGLDGHDNLATACKHVIDEVAAWMGVDDRDERVEWRVEQEHGPWGARVRIEDRERSTT